jgi:hypothetical protein
MLIDVNSPLAGESLDRGAPWTTYTSSYLNRTFAVVEAFKSYENTLLFFAGNEVINDLASGGVVPPYMRVSPAYTHCYAIPYMSRLSSGTSKTTLRSTPRGVYPLATVLQMSGQFWLILGIIFNVPLRAPLQTHPEPTSLP